MLFIKSFCSIHLHVTFSQYHLLARKYADRIIEMDASKPVEIVFENTFKIVNSFIQKNK